MKKRVFLFIIPLLLLIACSNININNSSNRSASKSSSAKSKIKSKYSINDFIPYKDNVQIYFENSSFGVSDKFIYVDIIKHNRIQLRIINGTSQTGEILEVKNGQLSLISDISNFNYYDDLTSAQNLKPEILLKEPIAKGTSWSLPDGSKRYIANVDVKVSTAHSTYDTAIEVITENKDSKSYAYYVPNLGLVKTVQKNNASTNAFLFSSITENTPYTQNIKFYYIDPNSYKIAYINKKIPIKTNTDIKDIFNDNFKTPPNSNLKCILPKGTTINDIDYDSDQKIVTIDLSKDFVTAMKSAGYSDEKKTIQCITNTLGNYFGVNTVCINIKGKPYSSDYIKKSDNKYFYVNSENQYEIK